MTSWAQRFCIPYTWGQGGSLWLSPATAPNACFTLTQVPSLAGNSSSKTPRYAVSFDNGYMDPVWSNVWLAEVGGTQTTPAVSALPPWKDNDAPTQTAYANGLQPVIDALDGGQDILRLEGYMPNMYQNYPRADLVQMVYLPKAVTNADYTQSDLIMVYLNFVDQQGSFQENGGGSGPPK